jgi:hypothetical protein
VQKKMQNSLQIPVNPSRTAHVFPAGCAWCVEIENHGEPRAANSMGMSVVSLSLLTDSSLADAVRVTQKLFPDMPIVSYNTLNQWHESIA